MEDYRLTQSGQEVQDILDGAAMQSDLTAETERAEREEQALQGAIDDEALARGNADTTLQGHIDDEEARAKAAEKQNADDIDAIEEKIPSGASAENKLATEGYVDDSVATASATFRGTYNLVTDLHMSTSATRAGIAAALGTAISGADNNDYAFVMIPTSEETPTEIARVERYKFNGTAWGFEYTLNNSGYTSAQWAAINSGITSGLVQKLGSLPSADDLAAALLAKQDVLTFDSAPTPESANPVTSGGVYTAVDNEKGARQNADQQLQQAIEAILALIPSAATALNQLADKAFVNSSIATDTSTFRGTYNLVTDLHLAVNASHSDIATALLTAASSADNNDYCFVQVPTSVDTPTEIRVTERYKFDGTAWAYEYDLNNSGFTAQQWEAINSAITSALVSKLSALPTAAELATELAGKQAVLTFDNQPTSGSSNPVKSGGVYDVVAAINAKIPSDADAANKMTTEARIATIIGALDATFDLTSADGHITFKMTQTDGLIASVQILTYDIASAAALTTLGGRVSLNESDISNLQAAYAALTQSDIVIVNGALPSSGQQQNIIYRQPDPDHTPPQFYSDYMWNGTTWVLMAQYNNAIDPRPKKGSQNLVTSGGVFDNMGALDVSELNATENPHTLATYADLSAALAAIPSDYQKGGMSIKFVQTSENKYVLYRLKNKNWSTLVSDWQSDSLDRFSQLCYTKDRIANKAILVFFADTSNSQENIEDIKIKSISNNHIIGGVPYYGIQFYKNGSYWGEYYINVKQNSLSFTLNNIYFHIIIEWDNIEEGQTSFDDDLDIINSDLKENDDRIMNGLLSDVSALKLEEEIIKNENLKQSEYDESLLTNDGYIDYQTGQIISPLANYKYSDLINLKIGEHISLSCVSGSTAAILSVYKNNQYIISMSVNGGGESEQQRENITFTATEDCQIRFGACIQYPVVISIYKFVNIAKNIFYNKKWACVGDSLTAINETTTKHYYDYIKENTGIIPLNFGYSGSGYAKYKDIDKAFYQRILSVPLDTDIVTIFGSFNDLEMLSESFVMGDIDDDTTDTLCGCINQTISNLYSILPTIQLGIVTPSPWVNRKPTKLKNSLAEEYVDKIKGICELRSIPCLDLFHCSNLRPWDESFRTLAFYNSDGIHPNEIGHKLIAGQLFNLLNKIYI